MSMILRQNYLAVLQASKWAYQDIIMCFTLLLNLDLTVANVLPVVKAKKVLHLDMYERNKRLIQTKQQKWLLSWNGFSANKTSGSALLQYVSARDVGKPVDL